MEHTDSLRIKIAKVYPYLHCKNSTDENEVMLKVNSEVYSEIPTKQRQLADNFIQYMKDFVIRSSDMTLQLLAIVDHGCPDTEKIWIDSIPHDCLTRSSSIALGSHYVREHVPAELMHAEVNFISFWNTTFCTKIKLTKEEFAMYSSRMILTDIAENSVTMDTAYEEDALFHYICSEDYYAASSVCRLMFQDTWTVVGVMSVVGTILSLLGLSCVIVSYSFLSRLRSGSGMTTLVMAGFLFAAQAVHEVGLEQFENSHICITLALAIHFLWLSAIFLMTCCTVELSFLLLKPLKAYSSLRSITMLKISATFALTTSALIIATTIISNYLLFGDIGYPAEYYFCFIKRKLSRQLGFGLPIAVAVSFNIILFTVTTSVIRRRPLVSRSKQDRIGLLACFRLSVITGVSWLCLFPLMIPGARPWLEYVSVVLLSSQGLLLASSLLLNRRILQLWCNKLNERRARHLRHNFELANDWRSTRLSSISDKN